MAHRRNPNISPEPKSMQGTEKAVKTYGEWEKFSHMHIVIVLENRDKKTNIY